MKLGRVSLLCVALTATLSCGGGSSQSADQQSGALSGNWQITLRRHVNPDPPLVFTGFLIQSGQQVNGSLILGSRCPGVGPITGTVKGSDVAFTINEFGQDISLTGTTPSGTDAVGGQFSNLAGGCTDFANTGSWSAFPVAPISGKFHGTFVSTTGNGTLDVTGTLTQGPNTGGSTATLSGTVVTQGASHFCNYLPPADVNNIPTVAMTGVVSGTTVSLSLFGPDGAQITQIGQIGQLGELGIPGTPILLVTPDGKTLTGPYTFPQLSSSCTGDQGQVTLTFD